MVVRSFEFHHGVAQLIAQRLVRQRHDGGGLAAAWGIGEEEVGHFFCLQRRHAND